MDYDFISKMKIKNGQIEIEYADKSALVGKKMSELTALALSDIGNYMRKQMTLNLLKNHPGLRKTPKIWYTFQKWNRKKENDLQVGTGKWKYSYTGEGQGKWYGERQEAGSPGKVAGNKYATMKRESIITDTVMGNTDQIKKFTELYLGNLSEDDPDTEAYKNISDDSVGGEQ